MGARLAAQDRWDEAAKRAKMAKVVEARVLQTHDTGDGFAFLLQLHNKVRKPITSIGADLEVRDAHAPPMGTARLWERERFPRFGSDAGTMRLARGKPKRALVKIMDVRYGDGSDWGYDD